MRTYTIRLDDQFFELLEELSRKTRTPKSSVVKKNEMLTNLFESAEELANDPENLKDIAELRALVD